MAEQKAPSRAPRHAPRPRARSDHAAGPALMLALLVVIFFHEVVARRQDLRLARRDGARRVRAHRASTSL